jgi:hypothetical protein
MIKYITSRNNNCSIIKVDTEKTSVDVLTYEISDNVNSVRFINEDGSVCVNSTDNIWEDVKKGDFVLTFYGKDKINIDAAVLSDGNPLKDYYTKCKEVRDELIKQKNDALIDNDEDIHPTELS